MRYILSILFCVLFMSLHLNVTGMFAESYILFYISFVGILLFLPFLKGNNNTIRLKADANLIVAFLVISLLVRIFIQGNTYGTFQLYAITICWLLFFVFTTLFKTSKHIEKSVFWFVIVSVILEIVFGFGQLFGWLDNYNAHFRLGGSFGSPSAYSAYLSVISPLILSVLLTYKRVKKADNLYYLLIICFIFILYLLFVSASRGAWLACILGCLLVLNNKYSLLQKLKQKLDTPIKKTVVVVCVSAAILAGGYWLYQVKANSAFGRILVWKVTAITPHDNLVWGNGIGYFEANYGKWQADYFAKNGGTEAERYVADYVTCAYNEFLEIALEQGIVGLLLLVLLFYLAFRSKRKTQNPLVVGAKASLVAVIVLMFVTFPLKNIPILLYLVFCLSVIFKNSQKAQRTKRTHFFKIIILIVGLLIAIAGLRNIYGYYLLQKGQRLALTNQVEKSIEIYENVADILCDDGVFHSFYGTALAKTKQYEKSTAELEKAIQKLSNPSTYILLGNNYKELKQYKKAEQAYLVVINMIPNKLYPKYLLAKLFIETGDNEQAEKWATEILAIKEKVPTTAAKEIKQEMEVFLLSKNNVEPLKTE